jgi:Photosynthetic reaction centre cytochrome C subunit
MPRPLVMVATLLTFSVLSFSPLLAQQAPPPAGAAHKQMPKPVNLKVLPQDTSPQDLMKTMFAFSQQLGVECTFCHAQDAGAKHPNFASDEKPEKSTARTMMLMTTEINAKYMSQIHDPDAAPDQKTVACGTCHRGHSMPITYKPSAKPGAEPSGMHAKP